MKWLKNPELRLPLLLFFAGSVLFSLLGFLLDARAGLLVLATAAVSFALFAYATVRRYRAIAALSEELDRILHGSERLPLSEEEGELAILCSEIRKMTLRLSEQADALIADRRRLSDALADVSHQLRTPLTALGVTVSLLSKEDLPREERAGLLRSLKRSLNRIDRLIDALLKLSRIDAGTAVFRREPVPVAKLVSAAAEPLLLLADARGQRLTVSVGEESFEGDPFWSAEALGNLIKNCIEHTPEGGEIRIGASENPLYTEIVVRDGGEGFSPEDLPRLFERFYRGRNAAPDSVGIGLALAREIAAAQNGTLTAKNASSGGAEFTLRFYKSTV